MLIANGVRVCPVITINNGGDDSDTYSIKVVDYDGTIIKEEKLKSGQTFLLPEPPEHSRLIFQRWVCSQPIVNNTVTVLNDNIVVGIYYATKSGKTEIDITLNQDTGKTVTIRNNDEKDWGDGTVDSLRTHTYSSYGNYIISTNSTTLCDGATRPFYEEETIVTGIFVGNNLLDFGVSGSFYGSTNLKYVTFPYTAPSTLVPSQLYINCTSLKHATIPYAESIYGVFLGCTHLETVVIPYGVTVLDQSNFRQCTILPAVTLPDTLTEIKNMNFYMMYVLNRLAFPPSIQTLGGNVFQNYTIRELDFSRAVSIPSINYTYTSFLPNMIIKVPKALEDEWKSTTNWTALASHIVGV